MQRVELVFGGFDVEVGDDFFTPLPEDDLAAWEGSEREVGPPP